MTTLMNGDRVRAVRTLPAFGMGKEPVKDVEPGDRGMVIGWEGIDKAVISWDPTDDRDYGYTSAPLTYLEPIGRPR